jgi:hypothetical protein
MLKNSFQKQKKNLTEKTSPKKSKPKIVLKEKPNLSMSKSTVSFKTMYNGTKKLADFLYTMHSNRNERKTSMLNAEKLYNTNKPKTSKRGSDLLSAVKRILGTDKIRYFIKS